MQHAFMRIIAIIKSIVDRFGAVFEAHFGGPGTPNAPLRKVPILGFSGSGPKIRIAVISGDFSKKPENGRNSSFDG